VVGRFVAFFGAWRDEHGNGKEEEQKSGALEVENKDLGTKQADFILEINELTPARVPDGGQLVPAVFIVASISNQGAPSVTKEWRFSARPPGGQVASGLISLFDVPAATGSHPDGRREIIREEDWLPIKTTRQPIQTGMLERGRLMCLFQGLDMSDLETKGTAYELIVTDIWDRPYKASLVYGVAPMVAPSEHFGLQRRFVPPTREDTGSIDNEPTSS